MLKIPNELILVSAKKCIDVYKQKENFIIESIPGYIILSIEGTTDINDWLTNIKFLFKREDIHRGFKINAKNIFRKVVTKNILQTTSKTLVITGHSLGGATALVLADMLTSRGIFNIQDIVVITFGSPRPGGRGLRERMKTLKHLRFVHGDDIVPASPPYFCGYVHTHPKIQLKDLDPTLLDYVKDHDMTAYYKSLKSLCFLSRWSCFLPMF